MNCKELKEEIKETSKLPAVKSWCFMFFRFNKIDWYIINYKQFILALSVSRK